MTSELSHHVDGNMVPLTSPKAGWQLPTCSLAGGFWKLVHLLRVWSLITPRLKCVPGVLVNLWTQRRDKGTPVDQRHRKDFWPEPGVRAVWEHSPQVNKVRMEGEEPR